MKKTVLFVVLLVLFVVSAIINYLIYSHFEASMAVDSATTIRKEIIQIHSVLLAILIGGLFARPSREERVRLPLAFTAIAFSVLWVLYISSTWRGYPLTVGANGPNGIGDQLTDRSTEISTLVSGILAYLCKKGDVPKAGPHPV
jgi:hypothetical protein